MSQDHIHSQGQGLAADEEWSVLQKTLLAPAKEEVDVDHYTGPTDGGKKELLADTKGTGGTTVSPQSLLQQALRTVSGVLTWVIAGLKGITTIIGKFLGGEVKQAEQAEVLSRGDHGELTSGQSQNSVAQEEREPENVKKVGELLHGLDQGDVGAMLVDAVSV